MVKINRCGTKLNKESDRSIFEPLRRAIGQYSNLCGERLVNIRNSAVTNSHINRGWLQEKV